MTFYSVFFNSVIYDLALIQSFFGIFEIVRTLFHSIHRRIFKNAKTLFSAIYVLYLDEYFQIR